MNYKLPLYFIAAISIFSCEFNKSVKHDMMTGIISHGDGLSCDDIYLTDGTQKITRTSFTYGETFYMSFENVEGFKKEDGNVFPGIQLSVVDEAGDTVLLFEDLYEQLENGTQLDPLALAANLTTAKPLHSGQQYTLHTLVWDKKGEGSFTTRMEFDVVANEQITVENSNTTYDEIYLFSNDKNETIIDNKSTLNEQVYFIIEGLSGFQEIDGMVSYGLKLTAKDANGNTIINEEDLADGTAIASDLLKRQLAPTFIISGEEVKSPVNCEVFIWDKNSDSKIKAKTTLIIS